MHEHHEPHEHHVVPVETRHPHISWGAVLAGGVVLLATSWMLHLLGLAIGVSLADSYDSATMDGTLTQGAALWSVLTWIVSFFLGAVVAARLSGSADDTSGMLHGVTLWGASTVAIVFLGYLGLSTLFVTSGSMLASATSGVASVTGTAATTAASGVARAASSAATLADGELAETVSERLKESAADVVASLDEEGGADVSEDDIRSAIEDLEDNTLSDIVTELTDGNTEGAVELLVSETDLTEEQANALVGGAYEQLEEDFGNPSNQQGLAADLKQQFAKQVDSYLADLDAEGGPELDDSAVEQAIADMDAAELQAVSYAMLQGETRKAKELLADATDLSRAQINDVVKGVSTNIRQEVDQYQEMASQVVETASDYSRGLLWLSFTGAALGLAISVLGGWLGAEASERYIVKQGTVS